MCGRAYGGLPSIVEGIVTSEDVLSTAIDNVGQGTMV